MSKEYGPIRRWLDKMGLMSIPQSEELIPTAELPEPDLDEMSEPEHLAEQELELSTADTKPLPPEMAMAVEPTVEEPRAETVWAEERRAIERRAAERRAAERRAAELQAAEQAAETAKPEAPAMDPRTSEPATLGTEMKQRSSGPLLDLGYLEPSRAAAQEEFVLDLDLDAAPDPEEAKSAFQSQRFAAGGFAGVVGVGTQAETGVVESAADGVDHALVEDSIKPTVDPMAQTQEMMRPVLATPEKAEPGRTFTEPQILEAETLRMTPPMLESNASQAISPDQLSPEVIDAIARRAVEMLSERAVQEIAWEVVPQLAELMIKRQLEEKSS